MNHFSSSIQSDNPDNLYVYQGFSKFCLVWWLQKVVKSEPKQSSDFVYPGLSQNS